MTIFFTLTLFIVTFRLRSMWRPMSVWACPYDAQCQSERACPPWRVEDWPL